jgi:hypothetical protein
MSSFRIEIDVENIYDQVVDQISEQVSSDLDLERIVDEQITEMIDENYVQSSIRDHLDNAIADEMRSLYNIIENKQKDIDTLNKRLDIQQSFLDALTKPKEKKSWVGRLLFTSTQTNRT